MKRLLTLLCCMVAFAYAAQAQTVYYEENFNSGIGQWTSIDGDGFTVSSQNTLITGLGATTCGWTLYNNGTISAPISTSWYDPAGAANDWLVSPEITVGDGAFLVWDGLALDGNFPDGYEVWISTTGATMADFTTSLLTVSQENASWTTRAVNLSSYVGQKVRVAFQNNSQDKFCLMIDNIKIEKPIEFDLSLSEVYVEPFVQKETGTVVRTYVKNLGSTTVNSFKLNYQADGEQVYSMTVNNANITFLNGLQKDHITQWIPASLGGKNIKIWISDVNGSDNDKNYANDTLSTNAVSYDNSITHNWATPLIEEFTSSTCTPCASTNKVLNPLLETNKESITVVKYQMDWPGTGDPYYNDDGGIRKTYYGVSGVPSLYFIGSQIGTPSQTLFNSLMAERSFYDVTAKYKVSENTVTVNADLTAINDAISARNIKAYIAVVEFKTTKNKSTNGETEFHYVEQKMLPDGNGTVVTAKSANAVQKLTDLSYTFTGTDHVEEMSDLGVVVFVQDVTSGRILGSTWATIEGADVKNDNSGNGIVSLYPNPANETSRVRYQVRDNQNVNVDLFDISGTKVLSLDKGNLSAGVYFEDFSTRNLANGQYIVKVTIGANSYSTTLNVVK